MNLQPLTAHEIPMVAEWFADSSELQWLDFGNGSRTLDSLTLKIMTARDCHHIRLFRPETEPTPIGLVAFSQIEPKQGTAQLWYLLGRSDLKGQGYTSAAVSELLRIGFTDLKLTMVHAWAVEQNLASIRVLEKTGFQYGGRRRQCHRVGERAYDRLNFDLLSSEFLTAPTPGIEVFSDALLTCTS